MTREVPIVRQALLMLAVALATRAALFGDPVIHSDEQLYLLVGDRVLDGALPYVDVWDRKPVGLFMIFSAIRSLGGDGVLAYQLVAALFAAATALVVARTAGRLTTPGPATAAGALYLIWLVVFDGIGGQAPVFYNLPVAIAAFLTVRAPEVGDTRVLALGGAAMAALFGVAIQIKYTTAVEGAAFGLAWLWMLRRSGARPAAIVGSALLWLGLALLPTVAALGFYTAQGHAATFIHANFLSVIARGRDGTLLGAVGFLAGGLAGLAPLALAARRGMRRAPAPPMLLAWLWSGAALLAVLVVGTFQTHYFLPLVLPLSILAAPGLAGASGGVDRRWAAALALGGVLAGAIATADRVRRRGTKAQVDALVRLIGQRPEGCLFSYGSEPILYLLTRSCLPTRFIFRGHLGQRREAGALGVDPVAETRRVLAGCPGAVAIRATKSNVNAATERLVLNSVRRNYTLAGTVELGSLLHSVYRLRPGACGARPGGGLP